jgi:molybdopterin-synthase adenylyltransferase
MNDQQLLRYSRHILLPEIGIEGQERIARAKVLIVGAGGLGSPAAYYLAAAGVGAITLADADTVDLTNLQRQILHHTASLGRTKVDSGRDTLLRINPEVTVVALRARLEGDLLQSAVANADVVLDCSDNFATRHAINRCCVALGRPLVSGAGVQFDGQISVFDPRDAQSPCYACLFPEDHPPEDIRCAVMGVFAPVTGIIGTMQAAEALKVIAAIGEPLVGQLLMLDARSMRWQSIRVKRDVECSVCGNRPTSNAATVFPIARPAGA